MKIPLTGKATTDERTRPSARRTPDPGGLAVRPPAALPIDLPSDALDLLDRAVQRVHREWPGLEESPLVREEIEPQAAILRTVIRQAARGDEADLSGVARSPRAAVW